MQKEILKPPEETYKAMALYIYINEETYKAMALYIYIYKQSHKHITPCLYISGRKTHKSAGR